MKGRSPSRKHKQISLFQLNTNIERNTYCNCFRKILILIINKKRHTQRLQYESLACKFITLRSRAYQSSFIRAQSLPYRITRKLYQSERLRLDRRVLVQRIFAIVAAGLAYITVNLTRISFLDYSNPRSLSLELVLRILQAVARSSRTSTPAKRS